MRLLRFVAFCVFVSVPAARATVLVPADLGELARDARAIVLGRVVALDSQWAPDRHTIETIVSLEVDEYLKGALGTVVRFRVPGGRLGRYRNVVMGAPQFSVGQQTVVFLGARGPSVPFVLGMGQGVYRVVPADDGLGWVVTPPDLASSVAPAAARIVRGDPKRRPLPLAEFRARVRDLVERAR